MDGKNNDDELVTITVTNICIEDTQNLTVAGEIIGTIKEKKNRHTVHYVLKLVGWSKILFMKLLSIITALKCLDTLMIYATFKI